MQLLDTINTDLELVIQTIKSVFIYLNLNPFIRFLLLDIILILIGLILLSTNTKKPKHLSAVNKDLDAIAGDDVMATQLDLAKAYLEMNQKKSAKKMLKSVAKQGTKQQQTEARQLMKSL